MYDNPNRIKYSFPALDFGAGAEIYYVKGPKGKKGRIYDYGVEHVTETFTADTTPGYISVGTAADADAYGEEISLGTGVTADIGTYSLRTLYDAHSDEIGGGGAGTVLVDPTVPADTKVGLHCVSPTGGTPAGIAVPFLIIDWDD